MSKEDTEVLQEEKNLEVIENEAVPENPENMEPQAEPLPKFETREEREEAIAEITMLNNLMKTTYYKPRYDAGNKNKRAPQITGSTPLNYWHPDWLAKWGQRIVELTERL